MVKIKYLVLICAVLFIISSGNIYAQQYNEISLSNGEHVKIDRPNSGVSAVAILNGKIVSVQKEDPDEMVRLIVKFKDHPLAVYQAKKSSLQKTSLSSIFTSLQTSHSSFKMALTTIRQKLSAQFKSDYSYTVTHDYYRVLNGVAIKCKRGMMGSIRALSIVEQVSVDREVKANLQQSVHQIRADIVQDSLGITGKGVLVGDVDTGIDYVNPALGGGFGPSFRVIGGYDFANNDNNPMDDHGHGTHVAGIIGANDGDTLRGVAPDVKFLAVKVLDANGSGSTSDVIAGIEYCLDPDGNPATDDAVDVINMSLGGTPSTDDPLDNAVDNAAKAGVLCVVAAGNDGGFGYGTIQSPGTSESALTVGACDSSNNIADFSSQGPDPIHSAIKPEVVAPGVNILSTILNNQTATWSGTSMAAPHVTGVAALLKQKHPSWTSVEIKAAIINSAHSVGNSVSVFAQGKGCVDALDAVNARITVEPGVASFGMVDLEPEIWMDTVKLTVSNFRSVSQNFQVSILEGVPTGATLTFDKTSFTLASGEETTILAVLNVPSSVPVLSTEPFAYLGKIKVLSDSDNVIIPFSFIKSTTLIITLDIPPTALYLIDKTNAHIDYFGLGQGASKYVIPVAEWHSIDILAEMMEQDTLGYYNLYVVNKTVGNPTGLTYVVVSHNEATINAMNDTIYSIHNDRVSPDPSAFAEITHELHLSINNWSSTLSFSYNFGFPFNNRVFFSTLDSSYYLSKYMIVPCGSEYYILGKSIYGIQDRQDFAIATGASNLFHYNVTTSYDDPPVTDPSNSEKEFIIGSNSVTLEPGGWMASDLGIYFYTSKGDFYFNEQNKNPEPKNDLSHYSSNYFGVVMRQLSYDSTYFIPPKLRTPNFSVNGMGEVLFEEPQAAIPPITPLPPNIYSAFKYQTKKPGDTIKIEQYAHANFPDYITYLRRGKLYMGCNTNIDLNPFFDPYGGINSGIKQFNGVHESINNSDPYYYMPRFTTQVFARNQAQTNMEPLIVGGKRDAYYRFDNISNSAGTLHVLSDAHPYTLLGQAGQCSADFECQIQNNSNHFPSFRLLQVSVDENDVEVVRPDQSGIIRIVLYDIDSIVSSATISLISASGDEINLPVSYVGEHEYDALIPTSLPAGFMDIVARVEDKKGNKCELTASPGFYFGSNLDSIHLDARLRLTSYVLNNVDAVKMQNGDTLNYTLSYFNYGNVTARNIAVTFPTTPYFKPVGSQSWTKSSLAINDTVHIPVSLVFLGKQNPSDSLAYYSPSVSWISGGTDYLRTHKILVDFQNTITGVEQTENTVPNKFELYQNYPNPFNPSTTIRFSIPKAGYATLKVYNILGEEIATLLNGYTTSGTHEVQFNAANLASGIYFYRLSSGNFTEVKKMMMMK